MCSLCFLNFDGAINAVRTVYRVVPSFERDDRALVDVLDQREAARVSKVLGTTPQLWLNLRTDYDLETALRMLGKKLAKIEPVESISA